MQDASRDAVILVDCCKRDDGDGELDSMEGDGEAARISAGKRVASKMMHVYVRT
jgi:hypothetical protein